ncbi:MAG: thioredoxin-dependent thiol peroxidase [Longimicrobiales bacterium]
MAARPAVGEPAPDFELPDQDGRPVRLADFRGHKVVLYFYPKDDTPGCTTQACDLRDRTEALDARGAVVLGVSPDSPKSHTKFRTKYALPFTLLADTEHAVADRYGVWVEKSMYGRTYWGTERTTFLVDEQGRIEQVFQKVKPEAHAGQVLHAI